MTWTGCVCIKSIKGRGGGWPDELLQKRNSRFLTRLQTKGDVTNKEKWPGSQHGTKCVNPQKIQQQGKHIRVSFNQLHHRAQPRACSRVDSRIADPKFNEVLKSVSRPTVGGPHSMQHTLHSSGLHSVCPPKESLKWETKPGHFQLTRRS